MCCEKRSRRKWQNLALCTSQWLGEASQPPPPQPWQQSHTCQVGLPHRLWHTFELLGDRFPSSCSWAIAAVDLCLERFRWADAVCAMELHRGRLADADHLRWARVVLRNYRSSRSVSCHHRREHTSTFQPSTAHQRHGRRGQTSYRALLWAPHDCAVTNSKDARICEIRSARCWHQISPLLARQGLLARSRHQIFSQSVAVILRAAASAPFCRDRWQRRRGQASLHMLL